MLQWVSASDRAEHEQDRPSVQPGPTDTELNPANGGELADRNRQLTAIDRYGTTGDVANLVAFIASPASSFMTGSIVTMDGGYNA